MPLKGCREMGHRLDGSIRIGKDYFTIKIRNTVCVYADGHRSKNLHQVRGEGILSVHKWDKWHRIRAQKIHRGWGSDGFKILDSVVEG